MITIPLEHIPSDRATLLQHLKKALLQDGFFCISDDSFLRVSPKSCVSHDFTITKSSLAGLEATIRDNNAESISASTGRAATVG
jgi:hypothetical protein